MKTPLSLWLYALACVALPVAWGLFIFWATDRFQRLFRRPGPPGEPEKPPVQPEYYI